jgi:hypothetical protein
VLWIFRGRFFIILKIKINVKMVFPIVAPTATPLPWNHDSKILILHYIRELPKKIFKDFSQ